MTDGLKVLLELLSATKNMKTDVGLAAPTECGHRACSEGGRLDHNRSNSHPVLIHPVPPLRRRRLVLRRRRLRGRAILTTRAESSCRKTCRRQLSAGDSPMSLPALYCELSYGGGGTDPDILPHTVPQLTNYHVQKG